MMVSGSSDLRAGLSGSALVVDLLARSHFPEAGEAVAVAASGGADSTALALLAVASGCNVTLHHVNHHIRPESGGDALVVADLAARLLVPFVLHDVTVGPGPNLEARARRARRSVLPPNHLTGHTLDDRAETLLINIMRGTGLDGIASLQPSLVHPIGQLRRAETHALVREFGVAVVHDASNDDSRFVRNRVRQELLPLMDDIAQRDVAELLARLGEVAGDDVAALNHLSQQTDPTDVAALRDLPAPFARRALRRWLTTQHGYAPSAAAIDRLMAVVQGDVVACEIAGVGRVRRSQGRLIAELPPN